LVHWAIADVPSSKAEAVIKTEANIFFIKTEKAFPLTEMLLTRFMH
jgi:hypothetical protein